MSMSRKNTQKLSSMTNLVHIAYGDETTTNNRIVNDFGGDSTMNRDHNK